MDFIGTIIGKIGEFYAIPFNMYHYDGERDMLFSVFFGVLIYGTTLVIAILITAWLIKEIKWHRARQRCQHSTCSKQWTTKISDGKYRNCQGGAPCCKNCHEGHIDEAVVERATREPLYKCPLGHGPMTKQVADRIVLDVCPMCSGVFLSSDEIKLVKKNAYDDGYDDGHSAGRSSGNSSGMVIGMAIGSAIN